MDVLLLLAFALAGTISGILGGVLLSGAADALILGGSTGLVLGVGAWMVSNMVLRAVHEHRLNRHFKQDGGDFNL
jgi:hypothetical protein